MKRYFGLLQILSRLCLFGLILLALFVAFIVFDHTRPTALPTPTGPYAVSRASFVWSDPSATDAMAPNPGVKRELVAWIWYPADPQDEQVFDDYTPPLVSAAISRQWGITRFLTRDLSRVHAHSLRDAALSPREPAYPVVLMLGGLSFTALAEELASQGYVVASFDSPYRSSLTVFPDGRVIPRAAQNNFEAFEGRELENLAVRLAEAGSADLSFALDQLQRLNSSDPSGRFKARLDLQRVGAFGHSLQGGTAVEFCHNDARAKACIDLDGIPWGKSVTEGVTQPVMVLLSDHDGESGSDYRRATENFGSLFSHLPADRWFEVSIRGANHFLFSDDAVLRSPPLMRVLRILHIVRIDGERQLAITSHYIAAFFDVHLKGAPASRLRAETAYPEVQTLHPSLP